MSIARIDQLSKPTALEIAWRYAAFAQQNLRSIGDGIGRQILTEPNERVRDAMLAPYFQVRRAQHQFGGRGR